MGMPMITTAVPRSDHGDTPLSPSPASGGGRDLREWEDDMVVKKGPSITVSLKLHVPITLGAGWSPTASSPGQWTEANLNSASEISSGTGHAPRIPCSGIEPLHAVLVDGAVALQSLLVRCTVASSSISPPAQRSTTTATAAGRSAPPTRPPAAPAELWVELTVSNVRANSHISANPALVSAWRLLLSSLVTYTREEARSRAAAVAGDTGEQVHRGEQGNGSDGKPGHNSGRKEVLEARALEAVYASLKPAADATSFDSACVGPAPGASGLNAVPAAVVMKGKV